MCRIQCALALVALCVGLAHSWDIAVSAGDQLIFYSNGTKIYTESLESQNLTALAYDEVHNTMLYVDKQNNNDAICGYVMSSYQHACFIERNGRNIQGLAFDPVKEIIFFTDAKERSINTILFELEAQNNDYGNLLIKMDDEIPSAITVDICLRYIYWTNTNPLKPTIERARFDGSEREIIVDNTVKYDYATYHYKPHSLVVDQQTQKIYWIEDPTHDTRHDLRSANLNGQNKKYLLAFDQKICPPSIMTVLNDSVFWVGCYTGNNSVNRLPKYASDNSVHPNHIIEIYNMKPAGIAAKYKIAEQTHGIQQCETIRNNLNNKSMANDFLRHSSPEHVRKQYEDSVCDNYCLQGNCSCNGDGLPICRCEAGYAGQRCEVDLCYNYCLNNGDCILTKDNEPACQCSHHEGARCESVKNTTYYTTERNVTMPDSRTTKITVTVEVKSN